MPRSDIESGGVGGWVRRWWRALVAETVATTILIWLGLTALLKVNEDANATPLDHPAWAFGFVVTANIMAFGPVSGAHMNPAVSLAAALCGRLPWTAALGYFLAQMLGGLAGSAVALTTFAVEAPNGCTAPNVSPAAALAVEAGLAAVLVLACCGAWAAHDDRAPDPTVPIKIGLVVAGVVFVGGKATGASLNPARSFGPALIHGHWDYHWIYWVGTLSGAAIAALFHRHVLTPARPALPRTPEEFPLDKP